MMVDVALPARCTVREQRSVAGIENSWNFRLLFLFYPTRLSPRSVSKAIASQSRLIELLSMSGDRMACKVAAAQDPMQCRAASRRFLPSCHSVACRGFQPHAHALWPLSPCRACVEYDMARMVGLVLPRVHNVGGPSCLARYLRKALIRALAAVAGGIR